MSDPKSSTFIASAASMTGCASVITSGVGAWVTNCVGVGRGVADATGGITVGESNIGLVNSTLEIGLPEG
ncbi:MAG: hypothetical protein WCK35_28875 [Chloroflexota bacterium]